MTAPSRLKPSALLAAVHIIASDGPGEVVGKLDAAFDAAVERSADDLAELAMLNKLIELGAKASYALAKSNSDDGHAGTSAYAQWQELRAAMGELIRAHAVPALQVSRQPDCPEGHVLREWTQGWNECAAYAERAALAATPQAPARHAVVTRRTLRSLAERDVLDERRRQVSDEGCSTKHDDMYQRSELALAAAWYATPPCTRFALDMSLWPVSWLPASFKPGDRRRELVKSGALIIAELERLDRAAAQAKEGGAK